ncbi:tetratricopeptide repeat protein [Virgisporangium ochraceum]|uniref:tetratricopeptide repeat protein n=1 Tax=Virgisporangium ochraceum TaxID=65505 RepID=UPI001940FA3E|nr:tetratricopeptide repeat protein [Virgisporangium ochraceum]
MDPRSASSIFTRGAVDLGALRPSTPPPAAARPAGPGGPGGPAGPAAAGPGAAAGGPGAAGPVVIDVTEATFQSEVLERSLTTPVVIDLWAEWCQPCKQLSPVLEKLAVEGGGAWVLAKIDVDSNPRIAQALRVQGIPMIMVAVGGQLMEGFSGVLPEPQVRQFIDAVLKAGGVQVEAAEDPRFAAADDALMTGDLDAAEQAFKKILGETPNDAAAEAGLAQVGLMRRIEGKVPAKLLAAAEESPDDVEAQTLAADVEMLSGEAEAAYKRLVALVRRTSGDEREAARKHLVSLFSLAGPDDPAVASARRALASALF